MPHESGPGEPAAPAPAAEGGGEEADDDDDVMPERRAAPLAVSRQRRSSGVDRVGRSGLRATTSIAASKDAERVPDMINQILSRSARTTGGRTAHVPTMHRLRIHELTEVPASPRGAGVSPR